MLGQILSYKALFFNVGIAISCTFLSAMNKSCALCLEKICTRHYFQSSPQIQTMKKHKICHFYIIYLKTNLFPSIIAYCFPALFSMPLRSVSFIVFIQYLLKEWLYFCHRIQYSFRSVEYYTTTVCYTIIQCFHLFTWSW